MEVEENCVDEISFDLMNPFVDEIYNSHGQGRLMSSNIHPSSSSSSSPRLISFESSNTTPHDMLDYNSSNINQERENKDVSLPSQIINFSPQDHDSSNNPNPYDHVVGNGTTRTRSQAQDHLMAERKRRQNLTQLFITLSKVVPGLRKLDKASLLEDSINYLKGLQDRVSDLEREEMKRISSRDMDNMNINVGSTISCKSRAPAAEINVRIAERHVLVKICCNKQIEMVSRIIPCEMEKMNLNVMDIRMMPFGDEALHLTILAQMQSKFEGTVKDIVNHLQAVFLNMSA